jgi:peptidoglycan/xylan/chitin deacetylase (PgdA/CDA1 family)
MHIQRKRKIAALVALSAAFVLANMSGLDTNGVQAAYSSDSPAGFGGHLNFDLDSRIDDHVGAVSGQAERVLENALAWRTADERSGNESDASRTGWRNRDWSMSDPAGRGDVSFWHHTRNDEGDSSDDVATSSGDQSDIPDENMNDGGESAASTSEEATSTDANDNPETAPDENTDDNNEEQAQGIAMVSLDFDDGWESAYQKATPILDAAGYKGTYFIITSAVGEGNYMSWDDIQNLEGSGNEIGDHTRTHPDFSEIGDNKAKQEIDEGYSDLQDEGITPDSFAYPYGHYDTDTADDVESEGMSNARTSGSGFKLNDSNSNPYALWGQSLTIDTTWDEVKSNIDEAIKEGKWYIIVIHRVDEAENDQYSVSHELVQQIVDYLKENNVKVVTNSEGVRDLGL